MEGVAGMLALGPTEAVLDIGCGDGNHLAALSARFRCEGHGIDISVAAIDTAARQYPDLHWIVANADRVLPYAGGSFHLVTPITARGDPRECPPLRPDDGTRL